MSDEEKFDEIKEEILKILKKSVTPTDYDHAKTVLGWVIKLKPNASVSLKISALGHDIDRCFPESMPDRKDFDSYEDYKRIHSLNSAKIVDEIIQKFDLSNESRSKIRHYIENHELGGEGELEILNDADALAFFDKKVLDFYLRSPEHAPNFKKKVIYSYKRLSLSAKEILKNMDFGSKEYRKRVLDIVYEFDRNKVSN